MAGFDRFGKVWSSNGLLDDPTDAEANQGWLYIGQAPPSVEQFNSTHRWWDEKDNWLYGQIANVILDAQLTPIASDLTTLLQALNRKLAAYVLKIGDTMTGALTMSGNANGIIWNPPGAIPYGPWQSSRMGFGWDGSHVRVKVDGTDVGTLTLNFVQGNFVIKSGDTMTGTLINQQTVQANYLLSMGDVTATRNVTGNYIHSNGNMDAAGNFAAAFIHSYGDVIADGGVHSNYIHSYGNVRADNYLDGQNLTVAGSSGLHYTHIYSNLDVDGNVGAGGFSTGGALSCANVNASGTVTAAYVNSTGNVNANNALTTNGNVNAGGSGSFGGNINANGTITGGNVTANSTVTGALIQSSGRITAAQSIFSGDRVVVGTNNNGSTFVSWNQSQGTAFGVYVDAGNLNWHATDSNGAAASGALMTLTGSGRLYTAGGVGTPSDRSLKKNIMPAKFDSLAAIQKLNFYSFDLAGRHYDVGMLADETRKDLPGAILPPPSEASDVLYMDHMALISYAYQAIAQLNDKISGIEHHLGIS